VIKVKALRKTFGNIVAVDSVSFEVNKGDVLGFIGPNGAGKTTTMRMLSCLIRPDSGTAIVNGYDIDCNSLQVRQSLGYLPEQTPLYEEMTVFSFLKFIGEIKNVARREIEKEVMRVVEVCSLADVCYQTIETLSKGYKKRVGLAQALISDPPVLILDEPTDGLDPNQKRDVRAMIRSMAENKAIIVSTHILEELEPLCNRSVIICRGKIVCDLTPEAMKEQGSGDIGDFFEAITRGVT